MKKHYKIIIVLVLVCLAFLKVCSSDKEPADPAAQARIEEQARAERQERISREGVLADVTIVFKDIREYTDNSDAVGSVAEVCADGGPGACLVGTAITLGASVFEKATKDSNALDATCGLLFDPSIRMDGLGYEFNGKTCTDDVMVFSDVPLEPWEGEIIIENVNNKRYCKTRFDLNVNYLERLYSHGRVEVSLCPGISLNIIGRGPAR